MNFNFNKKYFEKSLGKCKKSECSLCKSENPLYKKIPSEKNLLLVEFRIQLLEVPGTHGTKADGATELKSLKCQQLNPLAYLKISLTSFLITLNGVLNQFSNHLKQYFQSKIAKEYFSHQNSIHVCFSKNSRTLNVII